MAQLSDMFYIHRWIFHFLYPHDENQSLSLKHPVQVVLILLNITDLLRRLGFPRPALFPNFPRFRRLTDWKNNQKQPVVNKA